MQNFNYTKIYERTFPGLVKSEKDCYHYLKKFLFKRYFKIYSMVVRGVPDFLVYEFHDDIYLPEGWYEVKFKTKQLSSNQRFFIKNTCDFQDCFFVYCEPQYGELLHVEIYRLNNK
jgi:hypothetical protein